jgi:hypothetical protein
VSKLKRNFSVKKVAPHLWDTSVIALKFGQNKQPSKRRKFAQSGHPGTDVMIFKIFSPKIWQNFLFQTT